METAKHTPGLLRKQELQLLAPNPLNYPVAAFDDFPVATAMGRTPEEAEANAERMKLAWNYHDELVSRIRAAASVMRNGFIPPEEEYVTPDFEDGWRAACREFAQSTALALLDQVLAQADTAPKVGD